VLQCATEILDRVIDFGDFFVIKLAGRKIVAHL